MTSAVSRTDAYTDPQGLNELRTQANKTGSDPGTLRAVAGQFEALFIQMMLKSMRDAKLGGGIFDSDQTETYQGLFDQQISLELAKQQGLGLADLMVRQLQPGGSTANGDQKAKTDTPVVPLQRSTSGTGGAAATVAARSSNASSLEGNRLSPSDFIKAIGPHANVAAQQLGVDPRILMAQAALETGWGQTMIRDGTGRNSNNCFGIKADATWAGATASSGTLEVRQGVMQRETAKFRAYASPAESFSDYAAFLQSNPRYSKALAVADDNAAYVQELQNAGYATDPNYANKIMQIMQSEPFRQSVTEFKKGEWAPLG